MGLFFKKKAMKKKILMVCLGNICRSPIAEGILRHKLLVHKLDAEVDSCGFEAFHNGDRPDRRGIETAKQHGIDISGLRARLFNPEDFDRFDHIYVMDVNNYRDVASVARTKDDLKKVDFIMNLSEPGSNLAVPDPYYGGRADFSKTYEMLDKATDRLIIKLRKGEL